MGQLVKLVVGVWEQVGQRGWLFLEDPTERKYEIMVHENQTYASVMDLVRTRYSVGVETAVTLTYEFPEWMKAPGDLSPPPVDVKEDGDVELFMSIRIELPATRLMVTIGNEVVARYLFQRRDNYTVIGSSRDITTDNTQRYRSTSTSIGYAKPGAGNSSAVPAQDGAAFWEEMLAQCIMTASQHLLTGVCEAEDEAMGGKEALGGMMAGLNVSIGNTDVTDSSTDSSADPIESGIIRLAEELPVAPAVAKKAISIVEPQPANKTFSILEYFSKGKEKVCNEKEGKKKRRYESGHSSPLMTNPNFPDPITVEGYEDEAGELSVAPAVPNMAISIVEPQPARKGCLMLEYLTKGKEKVCNEKEGRKKRKYESGTRSPLMTNPNFPDPIPGSDTTDEDSDEDAEKHLYVGQVFMDRAAFKTHMSLYALANKFRFLCRRSEPGKMILVCRGSECKWRVYASKLAGGPQFQIKKLDEGHNCTVDERGDFKRHATSILIGEMVRNKFGSGGAGPRPAALREFMRTDHQVPISYWKAWKSRELALERGLGNTADSYRLLPSYLSQLAVANPGTLVAIETTPAEEDLKRFKYLFLAFGASAKGYSYMRKVVVVDGTHLKGKYNGCLLTASAQDANYQIFPIAFAIVDGENDNSWGWFFQKLKDVVSDGYDLVFVSDRHQSIYAGLHKVYPMAKHYACVLHLQRNIVSMFKKKHLAYLVSKAARAYRVSEFYKHFNEIKMIDINCADYLIRVGFEHWARSHSTGLRYNLMTSNIAESLNAALAEAREYPIVALIEYIRGMLMGWFSVRREASSTCGALVTPKVEELISRNFNVSTGFLVRHINKAEFEVRGKDGVPFCVNLEGKTCSCLEFDMLRIPCGHAVAAAIHSNRRVDELVGGELSRNNWEAAYALGINPAGEEIAPTPEDDTLAALKLAPPNTRRPPGRPKKLRMLSRGEFKRGLLGRKVRTCKRCGGKDHNRATCKNPI